MKVDDFNMLKEAINKLHLLKLKDMHACEKGGV